MVLCISKSGGLFDVMVSPRSGAYGIGEVDGDEGEGILVPCENIAVLQTKLNNLLWSSDAHYVAFKSHWTEVVTLSCILLFVTMLFFGLIFSK